MIGSDTISRPPVDHGDREEPRWFATIYYRTDEGPVDVEHATLEIADLHDIVERGPHWDTIDSIVIVRGRDAIATLTVEEAAKL